MIITWTPSIIWMAFGIFVFTLSSLCCISFLSSSSEALNSLEAQRGARPTQINFIYSFGWKFIFFTYISFDWLSFSERISKKKMRSCWFGISIPLSSVQIQVSRLPGNVQNLPNRNAGYVTAWRCKKLRLQIIKYSLKSL